jgi:hypothetical protein
VFRDIDSIQPGTRWRVAISDAIDSCQTFLLFWCAHSSRSQEVRVEHDQAITLGRPVVPVLLDQSVLPGELAEYQAIDLSGALGDHLTEAPWLKGREPAYVLRHPGEWELDQGRAALMKGLADLIAPKPGA